MLICGVYVNSKVVAFDSVGAKANSDAAASPRWIEKAAYDGFQGAYYRALKYPVRTGSTERHKTVGLRR